MLVDLDNRKWNWLDTFLFFTRTAWVYFNAIWELGATFESRNKWILFVWFIIIYFVPLLFYRPGYIHLVYFFIAETLLSGSMFFFLMKQLQMVDVYDFFLLPLIMIGYVSQVRPLIWIAPFISAFIFITATWLGNQFTENFFGTTINTALFYLMGFCLGRLTVVNNKKKQLIESIQEKNKALEQYSKRIEELTIMEERNRVSQDLHDTVGHIFTSVITSLDALPYVMKVNHEKAESSIKEISDLARNGLDDVRRTIHQLSPIEGHQPLSHSFRQIIDDFIKHTGTKIEYLVDGYERELGERTKYTLIRCLQEGLTNAKRHGQATRIIVKLSYQEEEFVIQIKDNGIGMESLNPRFGLKTMKDRITSLNGSLSIESEINKGTEIRCSIPVAKGVIGV